MPHVRSGAFEQPAAAEREKRVGGKQKLVVGKMVADVTRRVAGRLDDADGVIAELEFVSVCDRPVEARDGDCFIDGADDFQPEALLEREVGFDMIRMVVRRQDVGKLPPASRGGIDDRLLFRSVDRCRQACFGIVDKYAVIVATTLKDFNFQRLHYAAPLQRRIEGQCRESRFDVQPLSASIFVMHTDIVDLREFYHSSLGVLAERSVSMALSSLWARLPDERLVGLGYTVPYLDRFRADTERTFAFMPAGQGAVNWPVGELSATALVFDEELPLPDASVDRILMVHSLEFAENPRETLKEAWRVLAPGGRLVIVVPNRRGVWARMEHTPFGSGRPYSRSQLTSLLRETNFTPAATAEALFFPPSRIRMVLKFRNLLERMGRRFWPVFSGVIIVEAQKRLYQGLPVAARASRRVFVPVLAPQGVPTTRSPHQG
jgi:SAM-dependent methyltransferase